MSKRQPRRTDLNPADIYQDLGPITPRDRQHLASMGPSEQDRWFANIYGPTTSRYARTQYQQMHPHP